jgi:hypothetical protein
MPVIRGQTQAAVVTAEQRQQVREQLAKELAGERTARGPVIFEIPLDKSERIDILAVWDSWEPFTSPDRSNIILDVYKEQYKDSAPKIAQALGVTYQEAIDQQLLPYAVEPMVRRGELDEGRLKNAMLDEGGFALENGKVDLRFPTMALAEQVHRRLTDTLPTGYWSIAKNAGYLP